MFVQEDTLHYQNGPHCIILLHGYIGSIQEVRRTARALQKANYSVYAFNLIGHGTKEVSDIFEVDPFQWIQQLNDHIIYVEAFGYDSISIMGISLGGVLALNAAIHKPRFFRAVGAFNSPIIEGLKPTPIKSYTFKAMERILTHRKWPEDAIHEKIQDSYEKMDIQISKIDRIIQSIEDRLENIEGKVYIAKSEQDELIDPYSQNILVERLVNADVYLDSFENCKHVITTGPDFKVFQEHLIAYLDSTH
ncbi:alpha/beta hydrolase [Aerococcaceae bacterium WGS1372]